MQIFNYRQDLFEGEGEGFLFSHEYCAMSFFRYPNTNNLKGINLHVHPDCDDIDVIIEGRITAHNSRDSGRTFDAPAILANYSGTVHGFTVISGHATKVYGFRSPFRGGIPIFKTPGPYSLVPEVFLPKYFASGCHQLFETRYTIGRLHKSASEIRVKEVGRYCCLINLAKSECELLLNSSTSIQLRSGSVLVLKEPCHIALKSDDNLVIELVAKG